MVTYSNEAHRKRAMKGFAAFITECRQHVFRYKDNEWCCNRCYGSGRVVAPWEQSDPVEGYKNAERVDCSECNGTGKWDEKRWRAWFKKERAEFVQRETVRKEKERVRKQALAKLTPAERKALGV